MSLMADGPDLRHVVVHLDQLGRLDLTGALVLRSLVEDMERADITVMIEGTQPQARRLVGAVLGPEPSVVCELEAGTSPRAREGKDESHGTT